MNKHRHNSLEKFSTGTNREVKWWSYAAWTTPFVALAAIFFVDLIGWNDTQSKLIVTGGVVFFSVAVYWWWWAIFKVSRMASMLLNTAKELKNISKEMYDLNREIYKKDK